ncbi:hypothetical protein [Pinibacter soli]|uniref:Uncharacterized protein n=1 Tax=Pinibacter soli TaxID=3044211 RepID=A0ABT6RC57_9BACT|nr:hypothetical protein [Pinibacter soli]MDI3319499.1 hypothetical protein [Pinibacter soli]
MKVILSGAIANFSGLTNEQFLKYLQEKDNSIEYYRLQPQSGGIYSASLDWKAIGKVSAILGIASFLWQAYSELIAPHKLPSSNSGIVIFIENAGHHNQFWIGQDTTSEQELKAKLEKAISEIDTAQNDIQQKIIKESSHWKQIK